ncbi:MAG: glycosyltransferase, partial [Sphingomonadales bacterium]|nr:glycosyltransferase [Sphingomonadales bacterium]
SLYQRKPVSLPAFASSEISDYVSQVLAERPIGTIYAFSGQMGQFIPESFTGKVIFDFVDVDSAKFDAYAARDAGIRRWVHAREGRLLRAEEARLARRSDVSLLVSPEEAALFQERLTPQDRSTCDVRSIRNGIDSRYFDPSVVTPSAAMMACPGPRLIFAGQMDYAPNVEGALRVIDRLLPSIRATMPRTTFHVVGRSPDEELAARHGRDGVHVWGGVDDIRTFLAAADVALIPLEIARGVQNKVLEAMAMSLPVVLTTAAVTGTDAVDGKHVTIADTDEDLVDRTTALLAHPRQGLALGQEARTFVVENLSWQATLAPLADLIRRRQDVARHAA